MAKKTVRVIDIAKRAGVSSATVSLVLNHRKGISAAVVERVQQLAFEMGYQKGIRPQKENAAAQVCILQIRKSGDCIETQAGNTNSATAAIVDYAMSLPIQQSVRIEIRNTDWELSSIQKAISNAFTVFEGLGGSAGGSEAQSAERQTANPQQTKDGGEPQKAQAPEESRPPTEKNSSHKKMPASGLLVVASELDAQDISRLAESIALPSVFVDAPCPELLYDSVHINNAHIIHEIVKHLREQGYQRLAYVCSEPLLANCRNRIEALRAIVQQSENALHFTTLRSDELRNGVLQQWKEQPGFPDAFICYSDIQAYSLVKALRELDLRVPQDVGVVGFEDMVSSPFFSPPISSVMVPRREMGIRAFKRLMEKLLNEDVHSRQWKSGYSPVGQSVHCSLIVRESSLRSQNILK